MESASGKLSLAERLALLREYCSQAPQLPRGPDLAQPVVSQLANEQESQSRWVFNLGDILWRLIYKANPRYLAIGGAAGCIVLIVTGISDSTSKLSDTTGVEPYISEGRCNTSPLHSYPEIIMVNARVAAPGDQAVSHTLVLDHNRQQGYRSRSLILSPDSVQIISYQFEQLSPGAQAQIRKGQHQGEVISSLPIPSC